MSFSQECTNGYMLCVILVLFINGILGHGIEIIGPNRTTTHIGEPLNVTCHITNRPNKEVLVYAELARYGGTKDDDKGTPIMRNAMMFGEFEDELYNRYDRHFEQSGTEFKQTLIINGAFREDEGEYRCILYLRTDSSYRYDEDSRSLRVSITGNATDEEVYKIEHAPTTTTTTPRPTTQPKFDPRQSLVDNGISDYMEESKQHEQSAQKSTSHATKVSYSHWPVYVICCLWGLMLCVK